MDSTEVPLKRRKIGSGIGETSSPSSSISKNDYEVFLSFRGPDTRQGFTDCLYHALIDSGIVVFRDDDELPLGSKIDEIFRAIENSKICIVVLSPTFAASTWCLREVERMVGMKKDIVPIFYHVTPDDVKLKTKLYANDLIVHETKHGKEQVQLWGDALKQIPPIKGRELKNTGYIEFCKQTAKEILTTLKVKFKYEIKHLVEVPDELETALKLLAIGSDDGRRSVGIHGMGGIGKTTLAKIIFNKISDRFNCSCFLENIREYSSQGPDSLNKLQERLLKSLDPSIQDSTQIVDPMKKIQMNFQRKKVIIVLDDVVEQSHLDSLVGDSSWFGKGSRIIFTTRNAKLHEKGTSSNAQFYGLEKKEMDSKQAITLFSRHAFGVDSPPKDFESLSTEAISNTRGLPLALEVVGSLLHRRKAKIWREMIEKLKEAPHLDVQRKLKISYDALDVEQQEIFLDIACLFIGEAKKNPVYMWEDSKFYPNHGIDVLISMSLIKLDEKKCFLMHDQLRDLGRAIAAGSRFWKHKDSIDLLKRNMGKGKVEALYLEGPHGYLDHENFVGLETLRFLRLRNCGDFRGDFGSLIPKLRWLSLQYVSSLNTSNLYLRELVVLELFDCDFDETWPGWGQILISKKLKVLTLSHCNELNAMPDLSEVVNLVRLDIISCDNLVDNQGIGKLKSLTKLRIYECDSLRRIEDLSEMNGLASMYISCCNNLVDIQGIGKLKSLTKLMIYECDSLRRIEELSECNQLASMDISCCNNLVDIQGIGKLKSLTNLWIYECDSLIRIEDVSECNRLASIDISCCNNLVYIQGIGKLKSLTNLSITTCDSLRIEELSECNRLASIDISYCMDLVDIQCIGKLKSLTNLRITGCDSLQRIEDLSELNKLAIIMICGCLEFEGIDGGVNKLLSAGTSLSSLHILGCKCDDVQYPLSSNFGR